MNPVTQKAFDEIYRLLQFMKQGNARELHLRTSETAFRIGVLETDVWQALISFSQVGAIGLTTWNQRLWREVSFREWPTSAFFSNRDDSNYVRLRPAKS